MPNVSPNISLHLTVADETRNYQEVRLEQSGDNQDSNMMIIDKEIGSLKDWKSKHVVYSPSEPENQSAGDTWNEIIP